MNESVRNRIEERLRAKKMSQKDLAEKLDVTEVTVSRWLNGERDPSIETLNKIADALDTTSSYFFISDSWQNEKKPAEEKSGMSTGLKVTFGVILGLVIAAVAAGLLSKDEKDQLVDILKKDDD
ncbi:MAG: helix-turn-helix transcriptional regulator [Treponema sp.]|nr:helix-turn-helix transcriptional regulator [Treponema sp.]